MASGFIGGDRVGGWRGVPLPPEDDRFWALVDLVDLLDLSGFERAYRADGSGGQPFDPRLMVTMVLWCATRGVRSPSAMARCCREWVSLGALFGDRRPSVSTCRRFVVGHRAAWARVMPQVLAVCDVAGLVDVSITATDGTPLDAPSALDSAVPLWRLRVGIGETRQALAVLRADTDRAGQALLRAGDVVGFVALVCDQARVGEARLLRRLVRLEAAEQVAMARWQRPARADRLLARLRRHEATLEAMVAAQQQRCVAYDDLVAVYPHGAGRRPLPPQQVRRVINQRAKVDQIKKGSLIPVMVEGGKGAGRSTPLTPAAGF